VSGNSIVRATQATSTNAAIVDGEGSIRTSIEGLSFANQIRPIQTAGLLALIVIGKDGEGSAGLERSNPVDLPAFGQLSHEAAVAKWLVPWDFPRAADHQSMGGVKVGQAAVQAGIERIRLQR